ncbi:MULTISPECIES: DUF1003 domain-containing protein [Sphingobium]|uniref:DUF1003 domain-containing protein n=1 Tax=Sphingobium sp. MI1205 TaxID=407020 RepID=UPI00076FF481|nr:DUF1003 domain-containing protein [Sphingobium sp. MI1205]AMK17354.1 hypothetical protein K663_04845 [Sphingobium sp. MI1205]
MSDPPHRPDEPAVTIPPPAPPNLSEALKRNIAALEARRRGEEQRASAQEKIAQAITRFTGSLRFVYLHLVLFGAWIALNLRLFPGFRPFDPTFVILATWASVEAIFLSTFVLISQNRAAAAADKRADLDLQISLLAEHEITKLVQMNLELAQHLGLRKADDPVIEDIARDVAPEAVLDEIEQQDRRPDP